MTFRKFLTVWILAFTVFACSSDDDGGANNITAPASYEFDRNGSTTVSFSGQTTRIQMGEEMNTSLLDFSSTTDLLLNMYANENEPFQNGALNTSDKSIRSKTAASRDYFSTNSAVSTQVKADLASFLEKQVTEVLANQNTNASPGVAGQIADGSSVRYVDPKGLEYNQLFIKSLIGALMTDQMLNNYLSPSVLDEGTNVADNDAETLASGKNYTTMEHKWDEAYGYAYGLSTDPANPNATLGEDSFLNKYIGRVENDADFTGIAQDIFEAFKLGRAAIVAKNYTVRDQQAAIIREKISEIIGIRAVYYLQQSKLAISTEPADFGAAFHDLSEGYGFIYSLQFTRNPNSDQPYFTRAEVEGFLQDLMDDGENGLWDVQVSTLDAISSAIAERFNFSLEQAAN
ncbi:DUF4856 domain-containing protein [Flavobacteriaceae bacterium M23B6Z8]